MAALELSNISFSYEKGKKILNNISLEIDQGGIVSLLGPSGSGKTTLLQIASGLAEAEGGRVKNSFKNHSFVFQEPRLLPWKNVIDNILFSLSDQKENKEIKRKKAQSAALNLGLKEEDFKKYPKELSGGMAQRVSIARALVKKPDILFLDEPFGALDIGIKKEFYKRLIQLCKQDNITVFFITHDFSEAVSLSDRILFLEENKNGSVIKKDIKIDTDQKIRDSKFVYRKMVELLENKKIKDMFYL